jgi:chorismate mutase
MKSKVQVTTKEKRLSSILRESGRIIIAGPCSAESQEQVIETAKALAADGRVHFLRAGIWKPRTSPGSFEGVGTEGFQWLNQAKSITGLPFATEVGSERHVYEALKHGVDMVWIGARTVSNPFTIQEIAEAIRGVDIPVLVKNPLCPDINLWEGAINRFIRAGVSQIGAVHRGFSYSGKSLLRNLPNWSIPLMLRERMPQLPIICDPSHIAGNHNLVPIIAQRAMGIGLNGLMVEVHPSPHQALSDAAQQLLPSQLTAMLNKLFGQYGQVNPEELLSELRLEVDILDEQLLTALANRMKLVKHIANIKMEKSMEIIQQSRWESIVSRMCLLAREQGLRQSFIRKIFNAIHKESCTFQEEQIMQTAIK